VCVMGVPFEVEELNEVPLSFMLYVLYLISSYIFKKPCPGGTTLEWQDAQVTCS
jgi:hypothetical protein